MRRARHGRPPRDHPGAKPGRRPERGSSPRRAGSRPGDRLAGAGQGEMAGPDRARERLDRGHRSGRDGRTMTAPSREQIDADLARMLANFNGHEYSGDITATTLFFADLGLASIDAV